MSRTKQAWLTLFGGSSSSDTGERQRPVVQRCMKLAGTWLHINASGRFHTRALAEEEVTIGAGRPGEERLE